MTKIGMRLLAMGIVCFSLSLGCPATPDVGVGDETNDNGGDPAGDDGTTGGTDDDAPPDDPSGDLPVGFRLDGIWDDNGRQARIEVAEEVVAVYVVERFCDRDNGPVPIGEEPAPGADVQNTFFDFVGTLINGEDFLPGDTITGDVNICRYGYDDGVNGWVLAPFTVTVVDENTLSGEWNYDSDGDGEPEASGSLLLTRQQ